MFYPRQVTISRVPALLLVLLLLAAIPAAAAAQSAGDDQYVDPLSGITGDGSGSSGGSSGSAGTGDGTGASGASSQEAAGSASGDALPSELARTGTELPVTAAAGLVLLAAGVGLRRRAGARD